jgi:tRNA modification GTPase
LNAVPLLSTMLHLDDTICAVATPPGEGGIGIVRVSGKQALTIADRLFHTRAGHPSSLPTHTLHYGVVRNPQTQERIDDAVLLLFHGPRSFTGEDVVEFSCHGGPVTIGLVLKLALQCGARMAEPGEFTRRAFLNGRMDLAQAEAVCDQIRAKTEAAQRLASRQRGGALSKHVSQIRHELVGALAAVEVTIDFSEEVGDLDYPSMSARLGTLRQEIESLAATADRGKVYRDGVRLAIVGRPNVGKSSLMNALLREERAIVTPIAGTTRDVIEETANVCGIPITAVDTAGLHDTQDVVERIGVERAHAALETASLLLFVIDAVSGWTSEDAEIAVRIGSQPAIWVVNKIDAVNENQGMQIQANLVELSGDDHVISISAVHGLNMDLLEKTIAEAILGGQAGVGDELVITNARHQQALMVAANSLREAEVTTQQGLPPDFISIDIRAALDAVGQITGETATEEIIHRIFHDFCVGK